MLPANPHSRHLPDLHHLQTLWHLWQEWPHLLRTQLLALHEKPRNLTATFPQRATTPSAMSAPSKSKCAASNLCHPMPAPPPPPLPPRLTQHPLHHSHPLSNMLLNQVNICLVNTHHSNDCIYALLQKDDNTHILIIQELWFYTITTIHSNTNPDGTKQKGLPLNSKWDTHLPKHKPNDTCKVAIYTHKALLQS